LLNVFLTMLWFFMGCPWIVLVAWTILLIFRRRDLRKVKVQLLG